MSKTRSENLRNNVNRSGNDSTAKQNHDMWSKSNRHGSISFGSIHKKGDVTSGVMLQTRDSKHCLSMDNDGQRKGWTTLTQPANFSLTCGTHPDINDPKEKASLDSLFFQAENGNIIIKANNGKIRLEADDIEMVARGDGTGQGIVKINATQKIRLDSKIIETYSTSATKIVSAGKMEIAANTCMKIYSSIIRGVSDAVTKKDSKNGHKNIQKHFSKVTN